MLGCRSHRDPLVEGREEQVVGESRTLKSRVFPTTVREGVLYLCALGWVPREPEFKFGITRPCLRSTQRPTIIRYSPFPLSQTWIHASSIPESSQNGCTVWSRLGSAQSLHSHPQRATE